MLWAPSTSRRSTRLVYCVHFTATPPLAVCGQAVVFLDPLLDDEQGTGYPSGTRSALAPPNLWQSWRNLARLAVRRYCRGIVLQTPEFLSPSATRRRGSYPQSPAPPLHNRRAPESLEALGNNLVRSGPTQVHTSPQLLRLDQPEPRPRPGFVPRCCTPAMLPLPHCFDG